MAIRLRVGVVLLLFLAGCATYSNTKRFEKNYTYEGKTYSVWTSTKTDGGRTFQVYLLDNLDATTPRQGSAIAECTSSDLTQCEETFGAVLRFIDRKPPRDEGGMGY